MKHELHQCPYDRAIKCEMDETPCGCCEDFKPEKLVALKSLLEEAVELFAEVATVMYDEIDYCAIRDFLARAREVLK